MKELIEKALLSDKSLYSITGRIEDVDKCIIHRSVLVNILGQEPIGFVVDRYNGANTPASPPTPVVAWLNDNPKIGQVLYTQPQPKIEPLADELADALKTVLKWVDDFCETDEHFAESVEAKADAALEKYEAANNIKDKT